MAKRPICIRILLNKLNYNLLEDPEISEEDLKFGKLLNVTNIGSKGNPSNHPSISKYTNNPYKATSTMSFYNQLNSRGLGKTFHFELFMIVNMNRDF